jgi:hypothetical protein
MIKALLLIFEPVQAWDRVVQAQRSLLFVLCLYLMPMVVITSSWEGYSLVRWGHVQELHKEVERLKKFPPGEAIIYACSHALLTLIIIFLSAKLIKALGETFHGRHTYAQAFKVAAYGTSPLFLARLFDAIPQVNPWITWVIGVVLCASVLYQGVPRVMNPDPPHAFGLYFMSSLIITAMTGLVRFFTAWYLEGRFKPVEKYFQEWGAQLPI